MVKLKVLHPDEKWNCNFCRRGQGRYEIYSDIPEHTLHVCLCEMCGHELLYKLVVEIA